MSPRTRCVHHWLCADTRTWRVGDVWHHHTDATCKHCGKQTTFRVTVNKDDNVEAFKAYGSPSPRRHRRRTPKRGRNPRQDPIPTDPLPQGEPGALDTEVYSVGGGGRSEEDEKLPKRLRWRTPRA